MTQNATQIEKEAPKVPAPSRKPSKAKPRTVKAKKEAPKPNDGPVSPESTAPAPEQDTLTVPQLRALEALLKGSNVSAAARAAGCSRETLHRWLKNDNFAAFYRSERAQIVDAATSTLMASAREAARTTVAVMKDKSQPASVRLRAALAIQDAALRWREVDELAADITKIKELLGVRDAPQTSQKLEL